MRINQKLQGAFMFSSLDEKDKKIVIDAISQKKLKKGDYVFQQGDDGDGLYIIDKGSVQCYRKAKKDAKEELLKTYKDGQSFGELSLLYNAPRAASLKCQIDTVLFFLDRETFNNIVKESTVKKRESFELFLSKVDLLKTLDSYDRMQLADCLITENFGAD